MIIGSHTKEIAKVDKLLDNNIFIAQISDNAVRRKREENEEWN